MWGTVGISTGGKKSDLKRPRSGSLHAKPWFCNIMKWCMSFRSSGQRKAPSCAASTASFRSCVYLPVGMNEGGLGSSWGISLRGSPMILRIIRNSCGRALSTGLTFCATGLYLKAAAGGGERVVDRGSSRVELSTGRKETLLLEVLRGVVDKSEVHAGLVDV